MQNRRGVWGGRGEKERETKLKAGWCAPFLGRHGVRKESKVGKKRSGGKEAEGRGAEGLQLQTDNLQLCLHLDLVLSNPY